MSLSSLLAHPRFLPRLLLTDAVVTGVTALQLLIAADWLQPLLQLPTGLLRGAGLVLVPFVVFVFELSRRRPPAPHAVSAVIAINVAWVFASVWVVVGGVFQPGVMGIVFVLLQAMVVALFAGLGWLGLRRIRTAYA